MALLLALLACQDDVARWIEELGDESIEVRDAAERKLIDAGPKSGRKRLESLEPAEDEVRVRVKRILRHYDWGLTVAGRVAVDGFLAKQPLFRKNFGKLELGPFPLPEDLQSEWGDLNPKACLYLLDRFDESDDPCVRCTALYFAGLTKDPRALKSAIRALESKDAAVRYYGLLVCGQLGDLATIPSVLPMLKDSQSVPRTYDGGIRLSHVAAATVESLAGYPIDADARLRASRYRDSLHDPAAVEREWERRSGLESREAIRKAVIAEALETVQGDSRPQEQMRACVRLMFFGGHDDQVFPCLLHLWKSRTKTSKPEKMIPKLLTRPLDGFRTRLIVDWEASFLSLLRDPSQSDVWAAALGLIRAMIRASSGRISMKELSPLLPDLLEPRHPLEARATAALLLSNDRSIPTLVESLEESLQSPSQSRMELLSNWTDADFVEQALVSLGTLKAIEARVVCRQHLNSSRTFRRLAAAEALAAIGDDSAVPVLKEFLNAAAANTSDTPYGFRALYRLNREDALAFLPRLLTLDQEPDLNRWDLISFLLRENEPVAVEYYVRCIRHSFRARQGIGSSLLGMKPAVLIPKLIDLIEQSRATARVVLEDLAPEAKGKSVAELRAWWMKQEKTFVIDRERILKDK